MHIIVIIALARDVILIDFTMNCKRLLCLGLRSVSYIYICFVLLLLFFFGGGGGGTAQHSSGSFHIQQTSSNTMSSLFLCRLHEDISGALHNLKEVFNFRQCL